MTDRHLKIGLASLLLASLSSCGGSYSSGVPADLEPEDDDDLPPSQEIVLKALPTGISLFTIEVD
tara:strand:+ start:1025 stop:1219 length:195 start_codon:yes stop_codon:yes gene_type:complete